VFLSSVFKDTFEDEFKRVPLRQRILAQISAALNQRGDSQGLVDLRF
jgi:hypothetical protein